MKDWHNRGSFLDLLGEKSPGLPSVAPGPRHSPEGWVETRATTILAFHFSGGVLVAGDRRATAGNRIMTNRVEKVLEIDGSSLMAIAGSPAFAIEMARILEHSFKYYRRSQLAELSVEGKLRMLAQLLRENVPMAMQGFGAVVPIFVTRDSSQAKNQIFFYDILGAHFEGAPFAVAGSGSVEVQGILRYLDRWGMSGRGLVGLSEREALALAMRLLETASFFDSATGGVQAGETIYPVVKILGPDGVRTVPEADLEACYRTEVEGV
ncbi:MAG: Putative 20S proteasome beta-subunit [Leptospirillum sp. Group II 'C75']|jgi:proteasome beta subunit|uniref:proteasome endopeptidase complex n=2 Tax=Leptospirillum ferriphilum TaxID=178606 RepID=A0A059XVP8_9BACT|nr:MULTISPECIES: 20S proteasome beta-subunit [Leptospirillum]EAY56360.1 MAG: putative 20S proteasome beta-subunit [Leptospirillum rubarum]EIJ76642.1 MAG: Putative 20S proteasome beta-subunit [Leptospirillum sp. Group II 'C75']MCL4405747.1 proteasome subunit alpha [Bacillota bacterium]AIA30963.1 proteasome subunit alpha [Leptospirillum ferriphilum YSK]AKS24060.1 proteasome subunit alpha [Leptospirillum sp. Group II 'CF-1']